MKTLLSLSLALMISAIALAQGKRLPVPDLALANKGKAAINEVFGDEIGKAKTPAAKKVVAAKILAIASDNKETPENRWAAFQQARELGFSAGDATIVIHATTEAERVFALDNLESSADMIERASKLVNAANSKAVLDLISTTADQAFEVDNYRVASRVLAVGTRLAQSFSKEPGQQKKLENKSRFASELAKAYDAAKIGHPSEMGKFLCFRKNDWEKGLPMLQLAGDEKLVELAKLELRKADDSKTQGELALAWIDLAEKHKGNDRVAMLRRALYWYGVAGEKLVGLAKAKLEQQLAKFVNEIDEADVRDGQFSLYAGTWVAKYANGHSREFRVDPNGNFRCDQEKLTGNLVRIRGDVVNQMAGPSGSYVERFRFAGGTIQIDFFWNQADYPKKVGLSGSAQRKK